MTIACCLFEGYISKKLELERNQVSGLSNTHTHTLYANEHSCYAIFFHFEILTEIILAGIFSAFSLVPVSTSRRGFSF